MPRATFKLNAKNAKEVYLAGTFNNWDKKSLPMRKTKKGHYSITITLPYGTYEYLYLVNGNWQEDPNFPKVSNQYGTYNSVREIIKKHRKRISTITK